MLVNELAGDDTEHFFYALAIFCADLMAAVPDVLLTPEATAAVAVWRGHGGKVVVAGRWAMQGAWWTNTARDDLIGVELLCNIADAALEGHLAFGRVFGDNIALGADNMDDQVFGITPASLVPQLTQPHAHLLETLPARNVIA
jgi:hypothetical protein